MGVTDYGFESLLEILYCGKLDEISLLTDSKFQQIVSAADAMNAEIVSVKRCRHLTVLWDSKH